ncbi:MAG: NAD(P)H-hydrate dehydratase [Clostridia bacterium]|nr:NAD(P)H-hydrate dehydratase [Clostridia bacterium]
MKILSQAQIKAAEENAVNSGISSFQELMARAGGAAAEQIMLATDISGKRVTVICGKGNNGGDGYVIAEKLAEHGAQVTVYAPLGEPATEQARYYAERLHLCRKSERLDLSGQDIVVDALFGIGLTRDVTGRAAEVIQTVNASSVLTVSVDVPSGIDADSGSVCGCAIKADLTVTFIALKPGLLLPPASDFCGKTVVASIGVPITEALYETVEPPRFEKRAHNSHKGTFGTALLFCGSYGMAGAAILAAKAALRSGAGIVKAVLCDSVYAPFTASVPEAVCLPVPATPEGTLSAEHLAFPAVLEKASAVLFGCGCRQNDAVASLLQDILKNAKVPVVIDADGINILSSRIEWIRTCKVPLLLTPHPGEMARLCASSVSEIEADRVGYASRFAVRHGCMVILKGANTVVATPEGRVFFNLTGNPGMAKGGSGDVLAGILVSLLAQGVSPEEAAKAAVFLHGEAGDRACAKHGERGLLASDLVEELGK